MYYVNDGFYGINPIKVFECPCYDRKSFYGKAKIIKAEDNNIYLQSYNTLVCYIDKDYKVHRLWDAYSSTTMRHINSFLKFFDIPGGGKTWWNSLECEV